MDIRINQDLILETEIPFQSVYEFRMTWEINEHAEMKIKGIMESGGIEKNHDYSQAVIMLLLKEESERGNSKVLFCGPIDSVNLIWNHGISYIELKAQSASIKLDEKKICRSYQKQSQSYAEVMKDMSSIENGNIICTTEATSTNEPVICYKETIWEFEKRLASCQNSYIIPDIITGRPNLWFGMRKGDELQEDEPLLKIGVEIVKNYTRGENGKALTHYSIESGNDYSLGDWRYLHGKKCVIYKKEARFEYGDLRFDYYLAEEKDLRTEKYYNKAFSGLSLTGTVEKTEKEMFKIKFDIDGKSGEHFYIWRPETGNALYAMPEEGEKAVVYFMTHDDGLGIGVRCLDLSGNNLSSSSKLFETPKKGKMKLSERSAEFMNSESIVQLIDESRINLSSGKIEIQGCGKIKLHAKNISLKCSAEFKAITDI